jgi:hypothetical protein
MDACVTIKLGPSVEAGGRRDEVPLNGAFVLRDAGRQRLEGRATVCERYASQSNLHSGRNQFAFTAHPRADSQLRSSAHADNPRKSLMFAHQPIRDLRNTDMKAAMSTGRKSRTGAFNVNWFLKSRTGWEMATSTPIEAQRRGCVNGHIVWPIRDQGMTAMPITHGNASCSPSVDSRIREHRQASEVMTAGQKRLSGQPKERFRWIGRLPGPEG